MEVANAFSYLQILALFLLCLCATTSSQSLHRPFRPMMPVPFIPHDYNRSADVARQCQFILSSPSAARRGEGRSRWRQRPDAPAVLHEWRLGPGRRPGSLDAVRTSKGATPTTPGRSKPCASRRSWSRTWTRRRWRGGVVPRGPQSTSAGA
jgi:hypothetical protein